MSVNTGISIQDDPHILQERDELREKSTIKSLTVLKSNKNVLGLLRLCEGMQGFQVVAQVSSTNLPQVSYA